MLIDFTEIPPSNGLGSQQDIFEKFCRDFLESIGYTILSEPGRGADGGLDIKVEEIRKGVGGTTKVSWLVSCKHYARGGKSVTKVIEPDVRDRVETAGCSGFIGFYSGSVGQSLIDYLDSLAGKLDYQLFDNERIEAHIVGIKNQEQLFIRYFPNSYKKWKELYYFLEPVKLFEYYTKNIALEDYHKKTILSQVLNTTPEIIRSIRNNDNLAQALKNEKIKYIIVSEFIEYMGANLFLMYLALLGMSIRKRCLIQRK